MLLRTSLATLVVLGALAGCRFTDGTTDLISLAEEAEVVALEPGADGALRFEARMPGNTRYSRADHAAALLVAASRDHCEDNRIVLRFLPDSPFTDTSPVEAGEPLALPFECGSDA